MNTVYIGKAVKLSATFCVDQYISSPRPGPWGFVSVGVRVHQYPTNAMAITITVTVIKGMITPGIQPLLGSATLSFEVSVKSMSHWPKT